MLAALVQLHSALPPASSPQPSLPMGESSAFAPAEPQVGSEGGASTSSSEHDVVPEFEVQKADVSGGSDDELYHDGFSN